MEQLHPPLPAILRESAPSSTHLLAPACCLHPFTRHSPPEQGCPDLRAHHAKWHQLGLSGCLPTAALQPQDKAIPALDLVSGPARQPRAAPTSLSCTLRKGRWGGMMLRKGSKATTAMPGWVLGLPWLSLHTRGNGGLWAVQGLAHTPREP